MNRVLLRTRAFVRAARGLAKKNPRAAADLQATFETLAADAFHPQLKTHKLKGDLDGSWACSAAYDLRIVFRFVPWQGSEAILLETIGTHEEVY